VAGDVAERQTFVIPNAVLVELVEQSARIWVLIENITVRDPISLSVAHNTPAGAPYARLSEWRCGAEAYFR
jgi:hypothetical protein